MIVKISKPRKAEIYISTGRHSAAQVRKIIGADVVINGGLYDMKTLVPNCHLRVNGMDYATDPYNYVYGYGWTTGKADLRPIESKNKVIVDNYICDSWMVTGGKVVDMIYAAAQGGSRGNTAIGVCADGSIVVNVHQDIAAERCTPEELQQEMIDNGCVGVFLLFCRSGILRATRIVSQEPYHDRGYENDTTHLLQIFVPLIPGMLKDNPPRRTTVRSEFHNIRSFITTHHCTAK